ncbi:helix-turn-helix transcriptional regulator [Flavobacterium azooxidireducens]|uniref:Helix-turn-helix transcriptional regulator n=1 Tax=Flavobacterium azooxidireducens TaxID=1871076 RepID=A0ABY4KGK3_9FLAO|nr:AraC family transcriptional regulator [Flavobacterium azooxidireducens]UPQ79804.1 helix-turn-helix transcriptional regulator [Flavobacterium azooxidireducens]
MNIIITSTNLSIVFKQLHKQLGGTLLLKTKEYILKLNNDIACGIISGIAVENAIIYIEYDIIFKKDITIQFRNEKSNSIHFGYCSKGELLQSFDSKDKKDRIGQFQTGIFSNTHDRKTYFHFKKEKYSNVSVITLDASNVTDMELHSQLKNKFFNSPKIHQFSYIGSFNLKIAEKIEELNGIEQNGLIRSLMINSTVFLILALEIEQHKADELNDESQFSSLTKSNMEAVKEISQFIRNYPEINYTLKYLSRKAGLAPLKLQQGFKVLHDRTVSDYIRNVRVEVAEKLIRTTELNISEIVYSVGLSSRSYFSKIFKEKYNCSPKYYKSNQNTLSITA